MGNSTSSESGKGGKSGKSTSGGSESAQSKQQREDEAWIAEKSRKNLQDEFQPITKFDRPMLQHFFNSTTRQQRADIVYHKLLKVEMASKEWLEGNERTRDDIMYHCRQRSRWLSDPDEFYERYFERMSERAVNELTQELASLHDLRRAQDENGEELSREDTAELIVRAQEAERKGDNFDVVLFFSELQLNRPTRSLLGLFNLGMFNARYGMVHSGLIVGPVTVEWWDNSLVIPMLDASPVYFMKVPLKSASWLRRAWDKTVQIFDRFVDFMRSLVYLGRAQRTNLKQLAMVCAYYNSQLEYSSTGCNCQMFTEAAINALDIYPEFTGETARTINTIRAHGYAEMKFRDTTFESRRELHTYAEGQWTKLYDPQDKNLLRSFDNLCELRYQSMSREQHKDAWKWAPLGRNAFHFPA